MSALTKLKKVKDYFAERKYFFLVLFWVIWVVWYFMLNTYLKNPHLIHMELDDKIPFIEYFVVPYVIWYGYIVFAHLWTFFTSKRDFIVMCCLIFLSEFFSLIVLTAYPSMHDMRPDPSSVRHNVFTSLVFALYSTENPYCIFPSEHCMLAIAITVGLLFSERFRHKLWPKIVFPVYTVLVMMSTVFIKQHSIADVFLAMAMSVPVCLLTYFVICPKRRFEPKSAPAAPEPETTVADDPLSERSLLTESSLSQGEALVAEPCEPATQAEGSAEETSPGLTEDQSVFPQSEEEGVKD